MKSGGVASFSLPSTLPALKEGLVSGREGHRAAGMRGGKKI